MCFCWCTHGSRVHPTGLHSRHNHHRRIAEGCTVHYCICTRHQCRVRGLGFGLDREKNTYFRDALDARSYAQQRKIQHGMRMSRWIRSSATVQTITLTVFLSLVRAVTAVINRVTQLVAVDAAVVVTAEPERSLTLDVHCGWTERRRSHKSTHSKSDNDMGWELEKESNKFDFACAGLLTAEVKLLIWIISAVVVSVTFPVRLDAYVVLALKQEGGAVCAVGETSRWKSKSFCQNRARNQTYN